MHAGELQSEFGACFENALEHMEGELGRYVKLPAELADISNARGSDPCIADLDLLRCAEGPCRIRQVGIRQFLNECPAFRAHQREHRQAGSYIGRDRMRTIGRVAPEPCEVTRLRGTAGHHHELAFGKPRHGEVGLDAASLIAPLGIDDTAGIDVDIIGGNLVQHLRRILALDQKLREARLVEHHHIGLEGL